VQFLNQNNRRTRCIAIRILFSTHLKRIYWIVRLNRPRKSFTILATTLFALPSLPLVSFLYRHTETHVKEGKEPAWELREGSWENHEGTWRFWYQGIMRVQQVYHRYPRRLVHHSSPNESLYDSPYIIKQMGLNGRTCNLKFA